MSTAALKIVEGGKSTKGRPKKEEIEALRKDTMDKLQALGVLEEVKTYAELPQGPQAWPGHGPGTYLCMRQTRQALR